MAESLNYQQMSKDIVRLVGGVENIQSVSHCMTRLRFVLKAESKADTASLKAMKGVLGVVSAGGQYMITWARICLPSLRRSKSSSICPKGRTPAKTWTPIWWQKRNP